LSAPRRQRGGNLLSDKRFTGHQVEGTLYYMKARFYDPLLEHFMQPDRIVPEPANPQSLNRYSYVLNNPISTTYYVYGLDLISSVTGATPTFYLSDGLGSTTGLANGAGNVTDTYQYDAFGALRSHSGSSAQPFRFTGEQPRIVAGANGLNAFDTAMPEATQTRYTVV